MYSFAIRNGQRITNRAIYVDSNRGILERKTILRKRFSIRINPYSLFFLRLKFILVEESRAYSSRRTRDENICAKVIPYGLLLSRNRRKL